VGAGRAAAHLMQAVVLYGPGRLEVREVPCMPVGAHEVRVRVQAVGLCGTDLHIVAGRANYHLDDSGRPVPLDVQPQILGHEIAGIIDELGANVRDLPMGARVVVDQGRTCVSEGRVRRCEYCSTGDSHQCEFYREHGITGLPGGLAEYVVVPAVNVVRIDSDIEPAVAAMTEPLACVLHSCDVLIRTAARYTLAGRAERGIRSVVVCGAGPAGLLFVQYLRNVLHFDGLLLVSDPNPRKRALAERFGAEPIDPVSTDLAAVVRERTGGRRAELLIEAAGAGAVYAMIPRLVRKQATVVMYGHGHEGAELSVLNQLQFLEPTLIAATGASGGFEPDGRPSAYVGALRLIERGVVDVSPMITHRYHTLDTVPAAFAGDHCMPGYVKGIVLP